jgi:hypothetical protein
MAPGRSRRREETACKLHEQAAKNSYKAGHHEADWVSAKHKLALKTVHEQDPILREYIQ